MRYEETLHHTRRLDEKYKVLLMSDFLPHSNRLGITWIGSSPKTASLFCTAISQGTFPLFLTLCEKRGILSGSCPQCSRQTRASSSTSRRNTVNLSSRGFKLILSRIITKIFTSYIPRKPNNTGLLQWTAAAETARYGISIPFDFYFDMPGDRLGAHDALQRFATRRQALESARRFHWVADSAFASFDEIDRLAEQEATGTFSISKRTSPWLWEALGYDLGLNAGRTAWDAERGMALSAYRVLNDKNEVKLIKTISSGVRIIEGDEEARVASVGERRLRRGTIEYLTTFVDGTKEWLDAGSFISDDGSINFLWLEKAKEEDLNAHFSSLTVAQLEHVAESQNWKVRLIS